jgi:hypothetical protein
MSKTLKWVLGILAVLVLIAVVGGVVWAWQSHALMMAYRPTTVQPNSQNVPGAANGQVVPNGPRGYGFNGNRPMNGFGFRGPMMRGMRGFGPFRMGLFFLGGLFRLIIPLGVLALVAFFFYQMGKRSGHASQPVTRSEPAASQPAPSDQNPPKGEA